MKKIYILAALCLITMACSSEDNPQTTTPNVNAVTSDEVIDNFLKISQRSYSRAYNAILPLSSSLTSLSVQVDTREHEFSQSQMHWRNAMKNYMLTVPISLSTEFIDHPSEKYAFLNPWPASGEYITGIIGNFSEYPDSGVSGHHLQGGPTNLTRGYHVLEYLLWGPDNTVPSANLPGQLTFQSFDGYSGTIQYRRGKFATNTCGTLLVDLQYYWMQSEYSSPSIYGDIVQDILATNQNIVIKNIFKGTVLATEDLAVKHLQFPLDTNNSDNEHSAYSDNSLDDLKMGVEGISNLYYGIVPEWSLYPATDGPAIEDLVRAANPSLANEIDNAFIAAKNAVNAIPAPLDNAISVQHNSLTTAINALQLLKQKLTAGAAAAGYSLD